MNNIKTAKEILREMYVSGKFGKDFETKEDFYIVDTDEDHVVNAMIVYAQQFIDLAAERAEFSYYEDTADPYVDKESILNIKKQIK